MKANVIRAQIKPSIDDKRQELDVGAGSGLWIDHGSPPGEAMVSQAKLWVQVLD